MKRFEFLLKRADRGKGTMSISFIALIGFVLILGFSSCDRCPHDPLSPCDRSFVMELVNENGDNLLDGGNVRYYWRDVKVYKENGEELSELANNPDRLVWTPIERGDCGVTESPLRYRYFVHLLDVQLDSLDIDTVDFVFELELIECDNGAFAYHEVYYNDSLYIQSDIDVQGINIRIVK